MKTLTKFLRNQYWPGVLIWSAIGLIGLSLMGWVFRQLINLIS